MTKRDYKKEYENLPYYKKKHKWNKDSDRKKSRENDLKPLDTKFLMEMPCFYCHKELSNGIDRKNSDLGHTRKNSIPCCEKCNYILGDLSFEAKKILGKSLKEVREKGLFESWEIPTKRNKA